MHDRWWIGMDVEGDHGDRVDGRETMVFGSVNLQEGSLLAGVHHDVVPSPTPCFKEWGGDEEATTFRETITALKV